MTVTALSASCRQPVRVTSSVEGFSNELISVTALPGKKRTWQRKIKASIKVFHNCHRDLLAYLIAGPANTFFGDIADTAQGRVTAHDIGGTSTNAAKSSSLRHRNGKIPKLDTARRLTSGCLYTAILPTLDQPSGTQDPPDDSDEAILTWYNILFTTCTLLGTWKFTAAWRNQTDTSNVLDYILGTFIVLMYVISDLTPNPHSLTTSL